MDRPDIVVIGAGPHALTVVVSLLDRSPTMRRRVRVLDPAGSWLHHWRSAFGRLAIAELRSPAVHHPGPGPGDLERWRYEHGHRSSGLPYGIPTFHAFDAYCDDLIKRQGLDELLLTTRARRIEPAGPDGAIVHTDDGPLRCRSVVVASNPHQRRLPAWVPDLIPAPADRLAHAADVDLAADVGAGEEVVIVGGGLTAAHLAVGAADAGAQVRLVARRPLRSRMFDVEPGWLGPMHLDGFAALACGAERRRRIDEARDGGSIPPWMHLRLAERVRRGSLEILDGARVVTGTPDGAGFLLVLGDERRIHADRLWLATGATPTVETSLLRELTTAHATEIHDGLPRLTADLRWPGTPVHLCGSLAALELGPAAGNLWGARAAARRIAATLVPEERVDESDLAGR
jgi:cation diffusion facilitator CzcD-associated flavoprotein CzcO